MPKSNDERKIKNHWILKMVTILWTWPIDWCRKSSNIEFDWSLNSSWKFKISIKKCKNHSVLELSLF